MAKLEVLPQAPASKLERRAGPAGDVATDRLLIGLRRRPHGDYEPLTRFGVAQMVRLLGDKGAPGRARPFPPSPPLFRDLVTDAGR